MAEFSVELSESVQKLEVLELKCPNCGTKVNYILSYPRCGWVGCEREVNHGLLGLTGSCPKCGTSLSERNRKSW